MQILANFGEAVRASRKARKLTQFELADQVGCARVTIQQIEKGAVDVPLTRALKLAKRLNLSIEQLKRYA